jgi:hypothetical protein
MKRISILAAFFGVALTVTMTASAVTPVPFPSDKVQQVFIAAQTVTSTGEMAAWYAPGSSVVFRAYAVDPKSHKLVDPKMVKYFYVSIPGQPNVKLKYGATAPGASTGLPWSGSWTIPSNFATGGVPFKVLIKVQDKTGKVFKGQFQQMPSATAALTVTPNALPPYAPAAPAGDAGAGSGVLNASLYVDTVNGSGPVGIAKRPVGCSLSNVYHRGEQVVVRVWGTDLSTTDVLSNDNVNTAHFSIAGVPDVPLNYGAHGAIYFWANAWVIPATYPLGATTIHVVFNLENGKSASYDYSINIIP